MPAPKYNLIDTSEEQQVVIGVPFYGGQRPDWWTMVAAEMLRMSEYKNWNYPDGTPGPNLKFYATVALRGVAVQNQRNGIVSWFLRSPADWLWFIDDDTIPPKGVLGNLLYPRHTLVSGLYWGGEPTNDDHKNIFPLVYRRIADGRYQDMSHWAGVKDNPSVILQLIEEKALVAADAAGAGSLVIHRSVFEDIMKTHTCIRMAWSGGTKLVPKRLIKGKLPKENHNKGPLMEIRNGSMRERVFEAALNDSEPFPFFVQEHGRTEDLAFFEAAKEAGHQLYVNMGIESKHTKAVNQDHRNFKIEPGMHIIR